jgi:hypothetical protein
MEVHNVKLSTRKLVAFVTALAVAASFPVFSSADKGGIPHSKKPCPGKGKRKHKKPKPNNKGKKCGFAPASTTTTGSTGSTPSTTSTTPSTTSTTTTTVPTTTGS